MVPHGISTKRLEGGRHVVRSHGATDIDPRYCPRGCRPFRRRRFQLSMWKRLSLRSLPFGAARTVQVGGRRDCLPSIRRSRISRRSSRLCQRGPPEIYSSGARHQMGRGGPMDLARCDACRCRMHDGRLMPPHTPISARSRRQLVVRGRAPGYSPKRSCDAIQSRARARNSGQRGREGFRPRGQFSLGIDDRETSIGAAHMRSRWCAAPKHWSAA